MQTANEMSKREVELADRVAAQVAAMLAGGR